MKTQLLTEDKEIIGHPDILYFNSNKILVLIIYQGDHLVEWFYHKERLGNLSQMVMIFDDVKYNLIKLVMNVVEYDIPGIKKAIDSQSDNEFPVDAVRQDPFISDTLTPKGIIMVLRDVLWVKPNTDFPYIGNRNMGETGYVRGKKRNG